MRLLLSLFLALALPASAATATLSTGASCAYQAVTVDAAGNISVACASSPPPPPPVEPPKPPPPPSSDNPFVAWCANGGSAATYQMFRNGGIALSAAQEAQARAAGCYDPTPVPDSGGGIDRSGFYVSIENSPRVNVLQNNTPYTFTLSQPGTVRVFGVSGTEVTKVNGQSVIGGLDYYVSGTSTVITVESIGGNIGVQLTNW